MILGIMALRITTRVAIVSECRLFIVFLSIGYYDFMTGIIIIINVVISGCRSAE